jgi:alkylation response protein AidB-like acyl-CoA dehydrogenase
MRRRRRWQLGSTRQTSTEAADFEIAAAKLRANRAVGVVTAIAHQVHGAIGFTANMICTA